MQARLERESQHNATRAAELQLEKEELESRLAVHAHQVTALQQKLGTLTSTGKTREAREAAAKIAHAGSEAALRCVDIRRTCSSVAL